MTVEEMRNLKIQIGLTYGMIADKSGLSVAGVKKVFSGETSSPRYDTLRALEKAFVLFAGETGNRSAKYDFKPSDNAASLAETAVIDYSVRNGEYTIDDYEGFPENFRCELIDGVVYDMASPSMIHQEISVCVADWLRQYISDNNGDCYASGVPVDFRIDPGSDKTIVQPDVFVVCDRDKLGRMRVTGAPDLVIEVLSDSTEKKDRTVKLQLYKNCGVREYWLIDINKRMITVYDFENDGVGLYNFRSRIPVGIFEGRPLMDFAVIDDKVKWMYDLKEDDDED